MVQGEGLWVNPVWVLPGAPLRPELCGPHPDARSCPQLMGAVPKARLHGEDGQDREDGHAVPLSRAFTFSPLCRKDPQAPLPSGRWAHGSSVHRGLRLLMHLKPLLGFGQNDFTVVTFKQD